MYAATVWCCVLRSLSVCALFVHTVQIHNYFIGLARDLETQEVKTPEDAYKTHLSEGGPRRKSLPCFHRTPQQLTLPTYG